MFYSPSVAVFLPFPGKSLQSPDPDFEQITVTLKPFTELYEKFTLTVAVKFQPRAENDLVARFCQEHNTRDGDGRLSSRLSCQGKRFGVPTTHVDSLSQHEHRLQQQATFTIQLESLDTMELLLLKSKRLCATTTARGELDRLVQLTL